MKINISLDDPENVVPGFITVDPYAGPDDPYGRVCGDITNLSPLLDRGECEAIRAIGILDIFPASLGDVVLNHWISLLAHGGKLLLAIADVREASRRLLNGEIDGPTFTNIVHGMSEHPGRVRKVSYLPEFLIDNLRGKGLEITAQRYQFPYFLVEAKRP